MRRPLLLLSVLLVAACGDPMRDVPKLADQDVAEDAPTLEAAAMPEADGGETSIGGLFARLLSASRADDEDTAVADAPTDDATPRDAGVEQEGETYQQAALDTGERDAARQTPGAAPQSKAGAGFLGLAGKSRSPARGAITSEVPPGTRLPYGKVARVCGLSEQDMGKEVARFPDKRPMHRLYDSQPGNVGPHTLYLTGFSDGCARQFTASLAMFGSVSMHEQLRYGLPAEVHPYSDTDKAYETLKQKVCRVPQRKPCGARISRMERSTVFLSIYERFGDNARWSNLLLHDGKVLAQDHKAGG